MRRQGAPVAVRRAAVLAYRARAQGLVEPVPGWPDVLEVGVQDTPAGATAPVALRARRTGGGGPYASPDLALVHSLRGTMHLHRAADLPLLAAALRPEAAADLLTSVHGPFFLDRAARGQPVDALLDAVAAAMAEVMAAGGARTKGELSSAVTALVAEPVAPWCPRCAARHVHDGLFRLASLQAGLQLRPTGDGTARFLGPARTGGAAATAARATGPAQSRRELLRRFLRRHGPAEPASLAAWLGLTPTAARRWWALLAPEVVEVTVAGQRRWCHAEELAAVRDAPPAPGVWLLPPYDPLLELADRALLLPDPAARRQVWRAAANPGAVLADAEIIGVWRQRRTRGGAVLTVTAFGPLSPRHRRSLTATVEALFGPEPPAVQFAP
ncbi:MAG TPA: crosslink repair DNA glycosylase YcaQ family protein [Pilimelia sp.]|nr:crosslink repair DNA glycosylase YcaQ family protein [Pilimelia sp.]